MRFLTRRLLPVVATALLAFGGFATQDARAATAMRAAATPAPAGSIAQCDVIYKRMQFIWRMFKKATDTQTDASYRFVDSNLWHVAPLLAGPVCMQTDKTHTQAMMDAKRLEIGLTFSIAGAFTEANLKKYYNARAFANSFEAGVEASITTTKQAQAALKIARQDRPDFDQFVAQWTKEVKKLNQLLDTLNIPKDAPLNPSEQPGS